MTNFSLTIGWLYPDLMSTYGDRGNVIVLQKRCEWRKISIQISKITLESNPNAILSCDILFMGGAQDTQQEIVQNNLLGKKGNALINMIEKGTPSLFVCGAYQFLGKEYIAQDQSRIKGLGIFNIVTRHPGGIDNRLVGNIVCKSIIDGLTETIVGFENHGGRTILGENILPFAKVLKGFGNNGEDKTEGAIHKNAIGTYLHGPVLPKNPRLTDWLISKALEKKYKKEIQLEKLDDLLEQEAKDETLGKMS